MAKYDGMHFNIILVFQLIKYTITNRVRSQQSTRESYNIYKVANNDKAILLQA